MLNKKNHVLSASLALTAAIGSSSAYAEAPNMWWDHVEFVAGDQAACVVKAESVLADNVKGQAKKGEDNVIVRTDDSIAVVECLDMAGKTMVMVLVSSSDMEGGNKAFNAVKKDMGE